MSAGATLLKLQQIDLELARNKSELANMPELKELASKRKTYVKLKSEMTKLYAQRKDLDIELDDLNTTEIQTNNAIELPRSATSTAPTTARFRTWRTSSPPWPSVWTRSSTPARTSLSPIRRRSTARLARSYHRQVRGGREGRYQAARAKRRPPGTD